MKNDDYKQQQDMISENKSNIVRFDGKNRKKNQKAVSAHIPLGARLKPEYVGAAIFILIFIYVLINLYLYYTKDKLSIYEVHDDELSYDTVFKGIAIRDEALVYSDISGYINYYIPNGKRTANDSLVYSIDAGSKRYSAIKESYGALSLDKNEINEIKKTIYGFKNNSDFSKFYNIDEFRDELNLTINELINENLIDHMQELEGKDIGNSSFTKEYSKQAGVISYKSDNLFGITKDNISAEYFDKDFILSEKNLKSDGLIAKGDPVYRLCSNENWSIVSLISEEFYLKMLEIDRIQVKIDYSDIPIDARLDVWQKGSSYFACVELDQYMLKFINKRYLTIEFCSPEEEGYKIPITAIAKKEFYLVPNDYLESKTGRMGRVIKKEVYDTETGAINYEDMYVSVYYDDGIYSYIATEEFNEGDYIFSSSLNEHYRISLKNYLEGVFNVNKGFYIFRRIERIRENNDYCIIKKDVLNSVSLYDHIALVADDAVESSLISVKAD